MEVKVAQKAQIGIGPKGRADLAATPSFLGGISDFRAVKFCTISQTYLMPPPLRSSLLICGGVTDRKAQNLQAESGANKNAAPSIHPYYGFRRRAARRGNMHNLGYGGGEGRSASPPVRL